MSAQMTLQQQFESGVSHHQAGRLAEAERIYRQVLAQQPNHADALHRLGVLAFQVGRLDAATDLIRQAIANCSTNASYYCNLGNALRGMGRLDEAIACYQQAIRLKADFADPCNNLGIALVDKGQLDEAIACYRQAVRLKPDYAEAHNNLGNALRDKGRIDEAIACYRQAVRLKPDLAEVHGNLGNALREAGQLDEAIAACRRAIRLKPEYAIAHNNLGNVLKDKGELDDAIAAYRQAIRIKPDYAEAHTNLGNALKDKGQVDEAVAAYRQAVRLKPDLAEAHNNLGFALESTWQIDEAIACQQRAIQLKPDFAEAYSNLGKALTAKGQIDEAIAFYRQAIRLKPGLVGVHSNLVLTLHYHPGYDGKMIQEELGRWNRQHAEPLKKFIRPHANSRDPDRRLRIGYVSPDFRECVIGPSLLPLFGQHDHGQMEVFCYANVVRPDTRTDELRRHTDVWRSIVGLSDSQAVDLIRQDGIDILVDLALHTGNNRLVIFAYKPAPVQVTYLGYCGSTGIDTMDYRLSDPYLDPSDSDLSIYNERTIRLPETYWCYGVTGPAPDPSPPPAEAGYVTFGCLNNSAKVSMSALDLWAQILQAVPRSRLIVHFNPGPHLDAMRERFAGKGISPDRLEFPSRQAWPEYIQTYGRIDIALDPFPWGGGITTCDALWMGVPVVSLVGRTAVGRGGASILSN
ncbi:MAG: tetratricopeptide repeat protein, partial [Tepidisphaeraceae bacterium]